MTRRPMPAPQRWWSPSQSPSKPSIENAPPLSLSPSDQYLANDGIAQPEPAGARLVHVRELLEIIFLHLDFDSLIRAQYVCHFWRETALGTRSLKSLLYKHAVVPQSDNELFEHAEAPSDAMTGVSFEVLQNIWQWNLMLQNFVEDDNMVKAWERYNDARKELRASAQAIHGHPYPVPMPQILNERKCIGCQSWHNTIRSERLHPLIRRFQKERVCFKGWGTSLVVTIDLDYWGLYGQDPRLKHVLPQLERMRTLHTLLCHGLNYVRTHDLCEDLITRPLCTKLIVTDTRTYQVEQNDDGLRVGMTLKMMAMVCHQFLMFLDNLVRNASNAAHSEMVGDIKRTITIEKELEDTLRLFEDII